jgi:hypothetical protein
MKTKIVYSPRFGGFGLSDEAEALYKSLSGKEFDDYEVARHDQFLVEVVETLGDRANGECADLRVAEVDGSRYRVTAYDGAESVETPDTIGWVDAGPASTPTAIDTVESHPSMERT